MVETFLLKHLSNKSQLRHENIECRVAEMYVCEGKWRKRQSVKEE